MRLSLIFFVALLAGALLAAPNTVRTNATLTADWDTNVTSADLVFKVYTSSDVASPLTNWTVLTNVSWPGCMTNGTNIVVNVPLTPGQHYYFMTASNWWGESPPSNVTNAAVVVTGSRLRIQ